MNIEKIEINGYYVWVDKDAEIKEGDWFYSPTTKKNLFACKEMLSWNSDTTQKHKGWVKIIAASPELNLEGVLILMNIEKIEINGYYVWVDKDAEIKEGDWFINLHPASNYIDKKAPVFTKRFAMNSNAVFINPKKIIAASPELNLEGVLTYVEWLFENQKIELNGGNLIQVIKDVFIKGYQAAEKELPTWDDVRKSIELAQTVKDYGDYKPYTEEQIIKQIKQSKK